MKDECFISIGHPKCFGLMAEKIRAFVVLNETTIQLAKSIRKQFADHPEMHGWSRETKLNPSDLFYAVYGNLDSPIPFEYSSNIPEKYLIGGIL